MKNLILFVVLFLNVFAAHAQTGTITGTIKDSNRAPVVSANVGLEGTSFGTSTDEEGRYSLNDIPFGPYTLHISYLGYEGLHENINLNKGHLTYDFILRKNTHVIDEFVFTGVARKTLIKENPIPVKSISMERLEETPADNIMDVMAKETPGFTTLKTGANVSKPFIRGLGYNRVLTLYDGIRQEGQQWGEEHGVELDDYFMDRAEVIKGPSSIMYGSDALAGVVSFFPHVPESTDGKLHGKFLSEYHSNNGLIGEGLSLDYNDGTYLFSVTGSYRQAKNYRNPVDGRVYLTNFNTKNFSSLLGFTHNKGYTHLKFTLYENQQGIPDGSRDSLSRKFTYQMDEDDLLERPIVPDKVLHSYKVPDLSQNIKHYRLYLHDVSTLGEEGGLDLLLAAQQSIRTEFNHPEVPMQPGMKVRLNTLNYGLRYDAPAFANMETSLGINGMAQNNVSIHATDFPIPNYNLFDAGFYLYAKWKKDRWTTSGGVRHDLRKIKWDDLWTQPNPVTGFPMEVPESKLDPDRAGDHPYTHTKRTLRGWTASLGVTYRLSNQIHLKANVGRAYRAPNIPELASNGLDPGAHIIYKGNSTFKPEFSLQEDLGIRIDYPDFSAELSLFNNHVDGFIYLTRSNDGDGNPVTDKNGNQEYHYRQSAAQLYGGEFWLALHPKGWKGFQFDNSLSFVRGINDEPGLKDKGVKGRYLPLIPPFQWFSTLSKEVKLPNKVLKTIRPQLGMEFWGKQDKFFGLNETETETPGYVLINLGIRTEWEYKAYRSLTFMVQANNLLDKAYQNHLSRLKYFEDYEASPNGRSGIYNMGFNLIAKIILPF